MSRARATKKRNATKNISKPFAVIGKHVVARLSQRPGEKIVGQLTTTKGGIYAVGPRGKTFKTFMTVEGAKKWARAIVAKFDAAAEGRGKGWNLTRNPRGRRPRAPAGTFGSKPLQLSFFQVRKAYEALRGTKLPDDLSFQAAADGLIRDFGREAVKDAAGVKENPSQVATVVARGNKKVFVVATDSKETNDQLLDRVNAVRVIKRVNTSPNPSPVNEWGDLDDDILDEGAMLGSQMARALGRSEREHRQAAKYFDVTWYSPLRGKRTGFIRPIEAHNATDAKRQAKAMVTNDPKATNFVAKETRRNPRKRARRAKYKVGDMVYSYQNRSYKASVNYVRDDGVEGGVDYGFHYRLSLKGEGGYPSNSNWISENSLYRSKAKANPAGGGNVYEVRRHPSSPDHQLGVVTTARGYVYAVTYAAMDEDLTPAIVERDWKTDRKAFRPYNESSGVYLNPTGGEYGKGFGKLKWGTLARDARRDLLEAKDYFYRTWPNTDTEKLALKQLESAYRGSGISAERAKAAAQRELAKKHKAQPNPEYRDPKTRPVINIRGTDYEVVVSHSVAEHEAEGRHNTAREMRKTGQVKDYWLKKPRGAAMFIAAEFANGTFGKVRSLGMRWQEPKGNPSSARDMLALESIHYVSSGGKGAEFLKKAIAKAERERGSLTGKARTDASKLILHAKRELRRTGKASVKHNPSTHEMSERFNGKASGAVAELKAANSAPGDLSRAGKLVFLKLEGRARQLRIPGAVVCIDPRSERLWIAGTRAPMVNRKAKPGERLDYGEIAVICYETAKRHIGKGKTFEYVHNFGEDGGRKPHLHIDTEGMPLIVGGDYRIRREGIVN